MDGVENTSFDMSAGKKSSIIIIIGLLGLLISIATSCNNLSRKEEVSQIEGDNLNLIEEGKLLYNAHCNSCHKMGKKDNFLINNMNRYPYSEWFDDFIVNEDSLIQVGDQYTIAINEEYKGDWTHEYKLTSKEIAALKEYIINTKMY